MRYVELITNTARDIHVNVTCWH